MRHTISTPTVASVSLRYLTMECLFSNGQLLRHYAKTGKVKEMDALLSVESFAHKNLLSKNWRGRTAVHLAVVQNHLVVVEHLLCFLNIQDCLLLHLLQQDFLGDTPLHLAAYFGFSKMTKLLLSQQVKQPKENKSNLLLCLQVNNAGYYPLHQALRGYGMGCERLQTVKLLLKHHGSDCGRLFHGRRNVLEIMARHRECYETILMHQQETCGIRYIPVQEETGWSDSGADASGNQYVSQILELFLQHGAVMNKGIYAIAEKAREIDGTPPG